MTPEFRQKTRYVAVSMVTDTQTDRQTHRVTTVTLMHAPRVNDYAERDVWGGRAGDANTTIL